MSAMTAQSLEDGGGGESRCLSSVSLQDAVCNAVLQHDTLDGCWSDGSDTVLSSPASSHELNRLNIETFTSTSPSLRHFVMTLEACEDKNQH